MMTKLLSVLLLLYWFSERNNVIGKHGKFSEIDLRNEECVIGDLILDPAECIDENVYNLYLNFDYENASNDSFNVYGIDNAFVGSYKLADLPITIQNFQGSGQNLDYVKVAIKNNSDCYQTAEFEAPFCPGECVIGDLILDPAACVGENAYNLYLNFEYENISNDSFNVYTINDTHVGIYNFSDLPITIDSFPGNGQGYDYIKVCAKDNPDCCKEAEFEAPFCPGECVIGDLILDPAACVGENAYNLYLNFEHENISNDTFNVYTINDTHVGIYNFSDLPITIDSFPGNGQGYDYIKVCAKEKPDCCKEAEFEAPFCPGECVIGDLILDPAACVGENAYNLYLNFEYENISNDSFNVYTINDTHVGIYNFSDLPITIDSFPGNGQGYDYIKVCAKEKPDCCKEAEFEAPFCPGECVIGDLILDPAACVGENAYNLYLNFEYENISNDSFNVYTINDTHVGIYKFSDLPITIDSFPGNGQGYDYIKVCAKEKPDCCKEAEFEAPFCPGECVIGDLILDPAACVGENAYNLYLNFEYENISNDSFNVYTINDTHVGIYKFSNLPITIDSFPGNGQGYDYIKVCAKENPDCCKEAEFEAPFCPGECVIGDLILDPAACVGENAYNLYLNFEYENISNDSFNVYTINDTHVGIYNFFDLPITIDSFPGNGQGYDYIKVCAKENPDCCKEAEFVAPTCLGFIPTDIDISNSGIIHLGQNYPNPYQSITIIPFEVARDAHVRLSLFNALGQPVEIIMDKHLHSGKHEIEYEAKKLNPGMYFYHLKVENYQLTKTMVLTK